MWCRGLILAFGCVLLLCSSAGATSTESQQSRDRFGKRHDAVAKDNNGECPLTGALHNASLLLSGEELLEFNFVIEEIEIIIANVSLTPDEQISMCGYKLRIFFEQFEFIALQVQFFQIYGFGTFDDFCHISEQVDGEFTEELTVVVNGECALTIALEQECASGLSSSDYFHCKWLLSQINAVVKGSSEYQYRMVLIEEVFIEFEIQFGAAAFETFSQIQIGSFGLFGQFRRICKQFYRF
uniref:Secreted protein n=1 Tax=Steinernema glaseri TaxID=37863 RepID=A0A1I7Z4C7_9BILA